MIAFRAADPFPLVDLERHSFREKSLHSQEVDRWLGLRCEVIEHELTSKGSRLPAPRSSGEMQKLWFGLEVQALLTPYAEIRGFLELLRPRAGETLIDLGAAYGRMAFVLQRHFPACRFIGYEYVGERVREGNRCFSEHSLVEAKLVHCDLAGEHPIEDADYYFLYDFGTDKAIERVLFELKRKSRGVCIVARGRRSRYLIDHRHGSWLRRQNPHGHEGSFTIYQSGETQVFESRIG